jgi:Domain of unknown function (DUF4124)
MPLSLRTALVAALLAAVVGGHADRALAGVYKCVGEGGAPMYQDSPCPPGKELRNFDTDPAEVSVIPFREVPSVPPSTFVPKAAKPVPASKSDKKTALAAGADPTQRKFIHPGMSEGEVVAKIGPADMTGGGKGSKSYRWSYLPVPADPKTITTVVFDYGKVILVERKVVN